MGHSRTEMRPMAPLGLTRVDMREHSREIERLRRYLFQHRTQSECFASDEEVILPRVYELCSPATGARTRTLKKGGLRYKFTFPGSRSPAWIAIEHWSDDDRYSLHASVQSASSGATYTRFSFCMALKDVGRRFIECVEQMMVECRPLSR